MLWPDHLMDKFLVSQKSQGSDSIALELPGDSGGGKVLLTFSNRKMFSPSWEKVPGALSSYWILAV